MTQNEEVESFEIAFTDAVIDPRTMVVKSVDTSVAEIAVSTAGRTDDHTIRT